MSGPKAHRPSRPLSGTSSEARLLGPMAGLTKPKMPEPRHTKDIGLSSAPLAAQAQDRASVEGPGSEPTSRRCFHNPGDAKTQPLRRLDRHVCRPDRSGSSTQATAREVPERGVEPLCPFGQTGLSRPRIPFRHPGQSHDQLIGHAAAGPEHSATAVVLPVFPYALPVTSI